MALGPNARRTVAVSGALVLALGAVARAPARGRVLWWTGMEHNGLRAWWARGGGGEYDSDGGIATVADVSHRGTRAVSLDLPDGAGGARLFRWAEARANRTLDYSAWYLIPDRVRSTALARSRFWILFEFKSGTADGARNDPFWYVDVIPRARHDPIARVDWGPQSGLPGPHSGERGFRTYGRVAVPVGRWFQIRARLKQSSGFDGALTVWLDGHRLARLRQVRTGWPNCDYNPWCVSQEWAVTNYSDGLAPDPARVYVDDATIALPDT